MPYDPEVLREQLRKGREAAGLTLDGLAGVLGVTLSAVQKWEVGPNMVNADTLARIANAENLDMGFYFTAGMSPQEANLQLRAFTGPLAEATARIVELQRVSARVEKDPVIGMVKAKAELYELAEAVYLEDSAVLRRIKDFVQGVLTAWKHPADSRERAAG